MKKNSFTGSKFKKFKQKQKFFLFAGLYGLVGSIIALILVSVFNKVLLQSAFKSFIFSFIVAVATLVFIASCVSLWYGIKQLKKEFYFKRLTNKIVCKGCGDEVSEGEIYCDNCGIELSKIGMEKGEQESVKCEGCGCLNYKYKHFCKNCGKPINNAK